MNAAYGRDLDLNLLRVFVVVSETGSVTAAAARLYLTQPAISAALRRLSEAVGAPLFARVGRGLVLNGRGKRLLASAKPHLDALIDAALSPASFDPKSSDRVVRLGLSDSTESWLLPPLMRALATAAPKMRVIATGVQFRNVGAALASGNVDVAITVADELPSDTLRETLLVGGFSCLFDPRHVRLARKPTLARYLAQEHVIVSYNGDLRGVVEDMFGVTRRARVSVPSFAALGPLVDGSALVATVPTQIAEDVRATRPHLRIVATPFPLTGTPLEMLWRRASDDDDAVAFVRGHVRRISAAIGRKGRRAIVRQ